MNTADDRLLLAHAVLQAADMLGAT